MSSTPAVPAPKESWLSKIGKFFSKIIHAIATDAAPIEKIMVPVAETLLPQFAPLINTADGIFSKIVAEAVKAETVMAVAGTATGTGPQKLATVLSAVGPVLDGWVTSNFPGAAAVSEAQKAGLVNAVVAILNEVSPSAAVPSATA
jgi:hypothetical protein